MSRWCGGGADRNSCPTLATKLEAEKAAQSAHVKKVKNKLKEIKANLFAPFDPNSKRSVETIDVRLADDHGMHATHTINMPTYHAIVPGLFLLETSFPVKRGAPYARQNSHPVWVMATIATAAAAASKKNHGHHHHHNQHFCHSWKHLFVWNHIVPVLTTPLA